MSGVPSDRRILLAASAFLALAACGTTTRELPSSGKYLLPNATLKITPQISYTVEQIALAAGVATIAYLVYDPLAPNWAIEERIVKDDTYHFSLKAKSFRVGGDGEALRIIHRRALHLQRERGASDYLVLNYSEAIDSSTPLTSRLSEGVVRLVGLPPPPPPPASPPSPELAPAQKTVAPQGQGTLPEDRVSEASRPSRESRDVRSSQTPRTTKSSGRTRRARSALASCPPCSAPSS
jgi:hypothetical protein